jgi:hypothetical protein
MGHYSIIHILHNGLSDIERHPEEFVRNMIRAIQNFPGRTRGDRDIGAGGAVNCAEILTSDHADGYHMIVTGGNTGWDLGICGHRFRHSMTDEERVVFWLKRIAADHGYDLRKKPKKTKAGERITPSEAKKT